MPRGFGRLPFLGRRGTPAGASDADAPRPMAHRDPDAEPIGPPSLMPAAILRQVLFDATELTPAWAMARPAAAVATAEAARPKRARRAKPANAAPAKPARTPGSTAGAPARPRRRKSPPEG